MNRPVADWTVVILGAAGGWGRELARRLKGVVAVVRGVDVDSRGPAWCDSFHVLDACVAGLGRDSLLAAADLVVACLPGSVAVRAVDGVTAAMSRGALWVDTLSVKSEIVAKLEAAPPGIEALSINPLFAPSVDFPGQCVLSVAVRGGDKARKLTSLMQSWGAAVRSISAREHDAHAAIVQAATHSAVLAFGAALAELRQTGEHLQDCASTPPHRALLAILARLVTSGAEVYWEIQKDNPYAARARAAVRDGLARIEAVASNCDEAGFKELFSSARSVLGDRAESHAEAFRSTFGSLAGTLQQPGDAIPASPGTAMEKCRMQIDALDLRLVSLLGERLRLCRSIAEIKRNGGIPMMQPGRVEEVKRRASEAGAKQGLDRGFVNVLYSAIIGEACRVEDEIIGAPRES